jgi:hypothetical protein
MLKERAVVIECGAKMDPIRAFKPPLITNDYLGQADAEEYKMTLCEYSTAVVNNAHSEVCEWTALELMCMFGRWARLPSQRTSC